MKTFTLHEFADFLVGVGMANNIEHAEHAALEWAAQTIENEAKSAIGTYKYDWPRLQPETVARKAHGDTPLLETGEMRDSIEHVVIGHTEAHIGSNNEKAVWHELGTKTIPPRSFLAGAAAEMAPQVSKVIGIAVASAIASRNVDVAIAKLAIDAVKHLAHDVKEMIPDEDGEKDNRRSR